MMEAPTQQAMFDALDSGPPEPGEADEFDLYEVSDEATGKWRWGLVKETVFRRPSDDTFWRARYQVATGDGDTHGLREGHAEVHQVWPREVTRTEYRTKP